MIYVNLMLPHVLLVIFDTVWSYDLNTNIDIKIQMLFHGSYEMKIVKLIG